MPPARRARTAGASSSASMARLRGGFLSSDAGARRTLLLPGGRDLLLHRGVSPEHLEAGDVPPLPRGRGRGACAPAAAARERHHRVHRVRAARRPERAPTSQSRLAREGLSQGESRSRASTTCTTVYFCSSSDRGGRRESRGREAETRRDHALAHDTTEHSSRARRENKKEGVKKSKQERERRRVPLDSSLARSLAPLVWSLVSLVPPRLPSLSFRSSPLSAALV